MTRTLLAALALLVSLAPSPAHAQGTQSLDVEAWLQRPGVRLLAVEFYATWCKPCMKAVPAWKELHERYADQGLRLIVVATRDPRGQCRNPGWNPDDIVCDTDGRIADALGVGDTLPSAFLWSWRGDLIVRKGHVKEVAEAVKRELLSLPRLIIEPPKGAQKKALEGVVPFVQTELVRTDKVSVVAGAEAQKALAGARKRSRDARYSDRTRCKPGEALAANSVLRLDLPRVSGTRHLSLQLYNIDTGCMSASALSRWNARRPHVSVAEAVSELVGALRVPFESPAGPGAGRAAIQERVIEGTDDGWTAGSSTGQLALIRFESDPPGAAVTVDGKALCDTTPCKKALSTGPHQVEMTLADYLPQQKRVTLTKGQPVRFALEANFALVTVTSKPSGLPVTIDGNPAGQTPLRELRLAAGAHEVLINDGCHAVTAQTIEVERGQRRQVALKTAPRRAGILVRAEDSAGNAVEAQVAVDGASLGAAYEAQTVPLCSRELRVNSPGLGAWTLDLSGPRLAERQTATVTATLGRSKSTGKTSDLSLPKGVRAGPLGDGATAWGGTSGAQLQLVSFASSPEGAQVSVDGQPICSTPCTRALAPGSYQLKMRKARYVDRVERVSVKAGRKATLSWELEPDFGVVSVRSEPPGLQVLVDGKEQGKTPVEGLELSAGPHRIELTDRCFHASGEELVIKRGARRKVDLRPKARKAGVEVRATDPKGEDVEAQVVVDGRKLGDAPGTFTVPMCSKTLEVRHKKHGTWTSELKLREKKTTKFTAKLGSGGGGPVGKGFVRIAPGTFTMGSPSSESDRRGDEGPTHRVTISRAFSLQTTEVTEGQWKALMGTAPSKLSSCGDSCPVEGVSWWDALAYTNALSKREGLPACYQLSGCSGRPGDGSYTCSRVKVTARGGKPTKCTGYRLPTEAEWEYAARAGTTGPRYGKLSRLAWYRDNSAETHPVGKKQANAWGLHDMLGNVSEWTWDWYGEYSSGSSTDPVGASSGSRRVGRGCSWYFTARDCRAASRSGHTPDERWGFLGFRPARTLTRAKPGGTGKASLVFGAPIILGMITKAAVRRVLELYRDRLRDCYQRELKRTPDLAGKVTVVFTIRPDGSVLKASTQKTTLGGSSVERCVNRLVMRMRFDKPSRAGAISIVKYPLIFTRD